MENIYKFLQWATTTYVPAGAWNFNKITSAENEIDNDGLIENNNDLHNYCFDVYTIEHKLKTLKWRFMFSQDIKS